MAAIRSHCASLTFAPLYKQVQESILRRVSTGEWHPGDYLPSEFSLADEYQVSQGTLRKALNALTRENVLVRYQGKGTAVATMDEHSAMFRFFTLVDTDGQRVFPTSTVLNASTVTASDDERAALHLGSGDRVIRIERVRSIGDEPVVNELICISCTLFPDFDLTPAHIVNTLYEFYERNYNQTIASANETLSAVPASADDAHRLRVGVGAPVLEVIRVAFGLHGQPIEYRISRFVSNRYKYFAQLG